MKKLLNALTVMVLLGTTAAFTSCNSDTPMMELADEPPIGVSLATNEISTLSSIDFSTKTFVINYTDFNIDWKGYAEPLNYSSEDGQLAGKTNIYPKGLYTFYHVFGDNTVTVIPEGVGSTQIYQYDDIKNLKIAGQGYIDENSFYATGDFQFNIYCDDERDAEDVHLDYYTEKDMQKPVINGSTTFIVNVNNRITREEILTHFSAYDETDGETEVYYDETNYDETVGVGSYFMVLETYDKSFNTATLDIEILVVDIDKPVISGTSEYNVSYDACPTLDSIKSALVITDNYDTSLALNVVSDNYSSSNQKVGSWSIVFNSTDSSGNVSDNYAVVVNIHDKIAPGITAPQTIKVPTNQKMTIEEIKSKIYVEDSYDGEITNYTLVDDDNYASNHNKVGTYRFTVTATDSSGNSSKYTITLKTEDNIAPEFYVDNYVIVLAQGETLTDAMIKEYAAKVLNIDVNTIAELSGDYDTKETGKYNIRLSMTDGSTQDFTISVNDANGEEPKDLNYFEQIWKDFTNVDNIFKFENWNWLHYVAAAFAGFLLLATIVSMLKKKN